MPGQIPCTSSGTPQAARLLGADLAQLEAQLSAGAQSREPAQPDTGSGLRLDQAAAAFLAVTSDRRAEVLVGPAGSGKTRTAAVVAGLWRQAGLGEVYGLTTSQAARDVLHEAGVDLAANTADFLGHLTGAREARGPKTLRPGTLLLLDEASMMSMADLAAIMRLAAQHQCRVLITGDHEQLAAVEGGGGMVMLARQMGYIQLAEPVRFTCEWERDATLRLRAGDTTVAALYEEHGRVRGGDPEEAIDLACRAFLADHLAGKDSLLLARTGEQAREMSRRVREDLLHYGLVRRTGEVRLRYQATASQGDLIVARKNNRRIIAGAPGRWLTNRDVLRIEAASRAHRHRPPPGRPERRRAGRYGRRRSSCRRPISSAIAIWRTRPRRTPRRAAPWTPATSWSTGSATGRACTWPCPAAGTATTPTASPASPAPPTSARDHCLPPNSPGSAV